MDGLNNFISSLDIDGLIIVLHTGNWDYTYQYTDSYLDSVLSQLQKLIKEGDVYINISQSLRIIGGINLMMGKNRWNMGDLIIEMARNTNYSRLWLILSDYYIPKGCRTEFNKKIKDMQLSSMYKANINTSLPGYTIMLKRIEFEHVFKPTWRTVAALRASHNFSVMVMKGNRDGSLSNTVKQRNSSQLLNYLLDNESNLFVIFNIGGVCVCVYTYTNEANERVATGFNPTNAKVDINHFLPNINITWLLDFAVCKNTSLISHWISWFIYNTIKHEPLIDNLLSYNLESTDTSIHTFSYDNYISKWSYTTPAKLETFQVELPTKTE